ncbi:protein kinase superfamily protein [Actinidia rufa]|uniref:Protein kinase superfamily protein n=1 Tax=Actinidia rufa TaxID=165716 RepID=A0A7J0H3V3_9ERIC|nr:protein kinase superfamily protein [Actinidia rufa]
MSARRRPWRDCLPPPSHHPWPIGAPARPVDGSQSKEEAFRSQIDPHRCRIEPRQVEQLHKIFKLCGSPSEEYWKKSRLPNATLFKPQQPYKRCISETFKNFPPSSLPLIETLLAIDPEERGSSTEALNSEMAPDLAISRISSPSSLYLPGLATILLSLISSSIGLQIQPQPEMGRTGVTLSVVTRSTAWWWNDRCALGPLLAQSPLSSLPSTHFLGGFDLMAVGRRLANLSY